MKDYHINIFWSEEDSAYVADIPDLEYCSALGDSPAEELRELAIAKQLWLEVSKKPGLPIPKPTYRPVIYQTAS